MPVGTGIFAQQGMLSISETKRNHMGARSAEYGVRGGGGGGGWADSFTREEECIQNLLCTQRTFGNYWAFAVFSGPDLIANFLTGSK